MGEHETDIAVQERDLALLRKDVDKLTDTLAGLPFEVKSLSERVLELCNLVKRMQESYQTKETCKLCQNRTDEKIDDIKESVEDQAFVIKEEIDNVKKDIRNIYYGFLSCAVYVIWEIAKQILPKLLH